MDQQSVQNLVASVTELRQVLEETKKQYGAVDKLRSDWEERWRQTKDAMFTREDATALMHRIDEIGQNDVHRGTMIAPLDYTIRGLREVMREADPPQAREAFNLFLTSQPRNADVAEFHRLAAKLTLLQAVMRKRDKSYSPANSKNMRVRLMVKDYFNLADDMLGEEAMTRAFDTSDVSEWIPTILSTELARYVERTGAVIPNVIGFDLPASLWEMPITTNAAKARMFTEQTALPSGAFNYNSGEALYHPEDSGTVPTGKAQFNAEKLRAFMVITGDLLEESVVPMLDWGLGDVAASLRRAITDAIQNGNGDITTDHAPDYDTRNTQTGLSYDARQAWAGFRKLISANGTTYNAGTSQNNTFTVTGQIGALKTMGRYGVPSVALDGPPDVMMITSMRGYLDLLDTPEYITMEKAGGQALNVTGALGAVLGIPVIMDEYARQDVAATGFNTQAGPNTFTSYVYFHRPSWMLGTYRGAWTEQERLIGFDQNVVWAWWKGDFQKIRPAAHTTEAAIVNIT